MKIATTEKEIELVYQAAMYTMKWLTSNEGKWYRDEEDYYHLKEGVEMNDLLRIGLEMLNEGTKERNKEDAVRQAMYKD